MESNPSAVAADVIQNIPVEKLEPNPWNRTVFNEQALEELTASIRHEGIREALIVRALPSGKFQIASGNRRWLAAQKAGLKTVPCLVQALPDVQVAEDNITMNIQREDIPPLELARMVKDYMDTFQKNQKEAAETFGKDKTWVSHLLKFLDLPADLRKKLSALNLGWAPLQSLLKLPSNLQNKVASELLNGTLKPDQTPKRCDQLLFTPKNQPSPQPSPEKGEGGAADPLANLWTLLMNDPAIATPGSWRVSYGPAHNWQLHMTNPGVTPQADIQRLLRKIADAMGDPREEQRQVQRVLEKVAPQDEAELLQMEADGAHVRLPKNAAEQAELERLALQGPEAVYTWMYSANSPYTQSVKGMSWAEIEVADPVKEIRAMVEEQRQLQDPEVDAMIARRKAQRTL